MFTRYSFLRLFLVFLFLCNLVAVADGAIDIPASVKKVVRPVLCDIYGGFRDIATGVAAVVMVIAGVKWTASENDPGARKAAKDAMIHAIVGLLLLNVIDVVINMAAGIKPGEKAMCEP
ncbi:MAG: hypothetical protein FJY77_04660 [Candidatus Altiarchaeales archaeon]|nr:hypothetical protein [Candidatus Altiarchaeales archaeon]